MAGTVASVVTQTYAGRTAEGNKIYNIKAVMTATGDAEDVTTIAVSRLRRIIGTPGLVIGGNDTGVALRYMTVFSVATNVITVTIDTNLTNTKKLTFLGQVVGR